MGAGLRLGTGKPPACVLAFRGLRKQGPSLLPGWTGRVGNPQPHGPLSNHNPLLTAVGDVAHDVSGDPQFLHVAWLQRAPHSGLLGVAAAE